MHAPHSPKVQARGRWLRDGCRVVGSSLVKPPQSRLGRQGKKVWRRAQASVWLAASFPEGRYWGRAGVLPQGALRGAEGLAGPGVTGKVFEAGFPPFDNTGFRGYIFLLCFFAFLPLSAILENLDSILQT